MKSKIKIVQVTYTILPEYAETSSGNISLVKAGEK